ncbi:MAG: hypothetical protein WCF84_21750 [Anaerolineae bacterium]
MENSIVALVCMVGIVAFIVLLWVQTNRRRDAFAATLTALQATPLSECPVESSLVGTQNTALNCYRLTLRSGLPATLITIRRPGTSTVVSGAPVHTTDEYLGIYLAPSAAPLSDEWVAKWAARIETGGLNMTGTEPRPYKVARTEKGGVFLMWHNALTRENLRARIAEVAQSLPA